jgi:hypothetical protein
VKSDLRFTWQPRLWNNGMSAVYLFHRAMFAHSRPTTDSFFPASASPRLRPVRLVFFDDLPRDNPFFNQWLARVRRRYEVAATKSYTVSPGKPGEPWLRDRYIVLNCTTRAAIPTQMARAPSPFAVDR